MEFVEGAGDTLAAFLDSSAAREGDRQQIIEFIRSVADDSWHARWRVYAEAAETDIIVVHLRSDHDVSLIVLVRYEFDLDGTTLLEVVNIYEERVSPDDPWRVP